MEQNIGQQPSERNDTHWKEDAAHAYQIMDAALETVKEATLEAAGPLNEQIRKAFSHYVSATSGDLPQAILIERQNRELYQLNGKLRTNPTTTETAIPQEDTSVNVFEVNGMVAIDLFDYPILYFIPHTLEMYQINSTGSTPRELNPETPEFKGFAYARQHQDQLGRGSGFKLASQHQFKNIWYWQETGNEERIFEIIDSNLPKDAAKNDHIIEAKKQFKTAVANRKAEVDHIKERYAEDVRTGLNGIAEALGKIYDLPNYVQSAYGGFGFYLPTEKRYVYGPIQRKTNTINLAKSEDVPPIMWVDNASGLYWSLTSKLMSSAERNEVFNIGDR